MGAVAAPPDARNPSAAPRARRRWPWWKRLLAGVGLLLLLVIVFYQPILFTVVKIAATKMGASQHLKIDFDIGGSVFGGLHVDHLHVTPTAPGPIEKATVGHLELHYSLPTLIRSGFNLNAPFLESVTLHDADVIYDPSKAPPSPPKKKEPFSLPPLPFPGQLSLRHVSFLLRAAPKETAEAAGQAAAASPLVPIPASPVVAATTSAAVGQGLLIQNLNLELDPAQNGELRVGELRIPGGPDLRDVSAKTSYRNRDLQLTDLVLAPEIHIRLLGIDASKLEAQFLRCHPRGRPVQRAPRRGRAGARDWQAAHGQRQAGPHQSFARLRP